MTERITNFYGQCIGTIETASNGDKTVKDFYGRILYHGDMAAALLITQSVK